MMADGWIKLYRKITEWEWYKSPSVRCVFLHLLLTANTKDKRYKGRVIKRGQTLTSASKLAQENGLGLNTVKRSLKKLEDTCEIKKEHFMNGSLITVVRYEQYQDIEYLGQPMGQPMGHNIRIKEYKNTRIPPPPPPAREGDQEKVFFDGLKGSTEMMKAVNEEFGVTTDKYWSLLASFGRECTAKGKKHTSLTDYKHALS